MVTFLAEVSSNHSNNLNRALEFVDVAAEIGCDGVKFQLFEINKLFAPEIIKNSKMHRERVNWELPIEFIPKLHKRAIENNIQFCCTPFYLEAVDILDPYIDFYKVASYELLWDDLLIKCAQTSKKVVLSTGMATMSEILHAVKVLEENRINNTTLLHCTSSYPTPYNEANLAAIKTIADKTKCQLGWSDHTVEPGVIHRAIHKWDAKLIEFHLDLDEHGYEYKTGHCWLPNKIKEVIKDVKKGICADGNGEKKPVNSELEEREWRADPSDGLRPLIKQRHKFIEGI
jgi:sialic acid synthase SpsE